VSPHESVVNSRGLVVSSRLVSPRPAGGADTAGEGPLIRLVAESDASAKSQPAWHDPASADSAAPTTPA
jgi:hypothetical protein